MKQQMLIDQKEADQSLLTIDDLESLLKLHRRTIYRLCETGQFPSPIKIGNSNRWRREDLESAIDGKD